MEDALVLINNSSKSAKNYCLNPCFNGRCTSTSETNYTRMKDKTSLNPCFNGRCTSTYQRTTTLACHLVLS